MIDIHSHILPGIDDGSQTMESSMELLMIAADSGVTGIVATPHCNIPDEYENYAGAEMDRLWERFQKEADRSGVQIDLYRGMEVFATPELPALLRDKRVWTLNDTSYFLTEFSFTEDPRFCRQVLYECLEAGFRPVIAHPERYLFVQDDPQIAFDWCVSGCALQLNKGSLLGRFGREPYFTAGLLMEHGLAACVASDAHSPYQRSTHMKEIRDMLLETAGESYMRLLLEENPRRILAGKDLLGYEPVSFI